MEKVKNRKKSLSSRYIRPAFTLVAFGAFGSASGANSCRLYSIPGFHTLQVKTYTIQGVRCNTLQKCKKNINIKRTSSGPTAQAYCVLPSIRSTCEWTFPGNGTGAIAKNCKTDGVVASAQISPPTSLTRAKHFAIQYNLLSTLLFQSREMTDSSEALSLPLQQLRRAQILGKITFNLVSSTLAEIDTGPRFKLGEQLDVSILTGEQHAVLIKHGGLIREALKQLSQALSANTKQEQVS